MHKSSSSLKDLSMNKGKRIDLKPMNCTGNLYKIRSGPSLPDTKLISKICPKKIFSDKEKLYEENYNLKQMYNYLNDENLKLRTKILQLEKNLDQPKFSDTINPTISKQQIFIESLKQNIRDLKNEIKAKDKEINDMKRYFKYSKAQELENENLQYNNECMRLKKIIQGLLEDKGSEGKDVFDKLKGENEEFRKNIDKLKDSDKAKRMKIEELSGRIRELGKVVGNEEKSCRDLRNFNDSEEENFYEEEGKKGSGREKDFGDIDGVRNKHEWGKGREESMEKYFKELKEENLKLISALKNQDHAIIEKTQEIENLHLRLIEKEQLIEKSDIQKSFKSPKIFSGHRETLNLYSKIEEYILKHSIDAKQWVKSIASKDIITKNELIEALKQDGILVHDSEVDDFLDHYGENGQQILASVLGEVFSESDGEILNLDDIFEVLKVKSTYYGIKDLRMYLESCLGDDEISESDIKHLFTQGIYDLGNLDYVKTLNGYFFKTLYPLNKQKFIIMFEEKFDGWVFLRKNEIEGIIRRFQGLIFDSFEVIKSRIQEKTRFQNVMQMDDMIQELKINEIISSASEETCAKAIIYYYSKSVKKVPYLQILDILYEGDIEEGFVRYLNLITGIDELKRSQQSFWISESNRSIGNALEESSTLNCGDKKLSDRIV